MMMLKDAQVLITGATGFLGGALARRLLHDGVKVRVIARTPEKATALRDLGAQVVQADLTDPASLRAAVQGCGVVFHVAVDYTSYAKQLRVNVDGTRYLAQASAEAGVTRFVHVSTLAVYNNLMRGDVYEDYPLASSAYPYALSKVEGERALQDVSALYRLDYTIIRPGMIYGEGSLTWTDLLFNTARRTPTFWLNDGNGSAHLIHVDDVVDLMVTCALHPAAVNQIFNCAPDPAPTWRAVLSAYAHLDGKQAQIMSLSALMRAAAGMAMLAAPPISMGRDLPDLLDLISSQTTYKMDKARRLLGWSPRVTLPDGIHRCAPYLRAKGLLR